MEGNGRFVSGEVAAKNFPERRAEVVSGHRTVFKELRPDILNV